MGNLSGLKMLPWDKNFRVVSSAGFLFIYRLKGYVLEFEPRGAVLSEMGIGIPIPLPFDVDLDERKLQMHSGGGGSVRLLSAIVTNN